MANQNWAAVTCQPALANQNWTADISHQLWLIGIELFTGSVNYRLSQLFYLYKWLISPAVDPRKWVFRFRISILCEKFILNWFISVLSGKRYIYLEGCFLANWFCPVNLLLQYIMFCREVNSLYGFIQVNNIIQRGLYGLFSSFWPTAGTGTRVTESDGILVVFSL